MERSRQLIAILGVVAICTAIGVSYAQTADITGTWSGTTRVTPPCTTRCDVVNNVTFTFDQQAPKVKGRFTCATGNRDCRHGGADTTGQIVSGRISGKQVRFSVVVSSDVSNCDYNGILTSATTVRGAYTCYQGGQLVEQGSWNAKRSE